MKRQKFKFAIFGRQTLRSVARGKFMSERLFAGISLTLFPHRRGAGKTSTILLATRAYSPRRYVHSHRAMRARRVPAHRLRPAQAPIHGVCMVEVLRLP